MGADRRGKRNTEALWRFNEYRAAVQRYGDTEAGRAKAIQAAADVTTNFFAHSTSYQGGGELLRLPERQCAGTGQKSRVR